MQYDLPMGNFIPTSALWFVMEFYLHIRGIVIQWILITHKSRHQIKLIEGVQVNQNSISQVFPFFLYIVRLVCVHFRRKKLFATYNCKTVQRLKGLFREFSVIKGSINVGNKIFIQNITFFSLLQEIAVVSGMAVNIFYRWMILETRNRRRWQGLYIKPAKRRHHWLKTVDSKAREIRMRRHEWLGWRRNNK